MSKKQSIKMYYFKTCKHSIRYKVSDDDTAISNPPLTDVYIKKDFLGSEAPKSITITVEVE